jgi:hypothetical protein
MLLEDLMALKGATLDLVKAVGGIARAAELTGISSSQVARWYAARDEKDPSEPSWVTIDVISAGLLERALSDLGDPRRPVTRFLARLNGLDLGEGEGVREQAHAVSAAAISFAAAAQAGITELMMAIADGKVTVSEATGCDRAMAEVEGHLAALRSALASASVSGRAA